MPLYEPKTPYEEQRSPERAQIGVDAWARLKANPGLRVLEEDRAKVGVVDGFLDQQTCFDLCLHIDTANQRSESYTETGIDDRRTSHSSNFDRYDPFINRIDRKIADLLGLPEENGETIQGQRYEPGQFFRPHPDYFYIDEYFWDDVVASGGQRTWTAMVFLNEPISGGSTRFIELGFEVKPKTGRLLTWNNMDEHGAPNPYTFHEGADVLMGRKHIITKWFREGEWR